MTPNTPKLIWILIETGYILNLSVKNVLSPVFKMTTAAGIAHIVITYFKQFPATRLHSHKIRPHPYKKINPPKQIYFS